MPRWYFKFSAGRSNFIILDFAALYRKSGLGSLLSTRSKREGFNEIVQVNGDEFDFDVSSHTSRVAS